MKDSYSFDRDEAGLDRSFRGATAAAYNRIFERCGIETFAVQAESGMMGGSESIDFLAPSGSGENTLVTLRERRLRGRPRDRARRSRARPSFPPSLDAPEEVETPGVTTIEALAELPRHRRGGDLEGDAGDEGRRHASCSRSSAATTGSRRRSSLAALGGDVAARRPTTRSARRSAPIRGSLGPVGFEGEVIADETLREGQFVAGANRDRLASARRRGTAATSRPRFADLRVPKEGDRCPNCGGALQLPDRDRGRPHLQARHASTRSRSARRSSTRTATRSRSSMG